jgi:hypothetical protein
VQASESISTCAARLGQAWRSTAGAREHPAWLATQPRSACARLRRFNHECLTAEIDSLVLFPAVLASRCRSALAPGQVKRCSRAPAMQGEVSVRHVTAPEDIRKCQGIRMRVFVNGQNVPVELELECEEESEHFLATLGSEAVGTGRLRQVPPFIKVERVRPLKM